MKAAAINAFGAVDTIELRDLATPKPGPGEVLVQCSYAGVNPVDAKICHGHLSKKIPHEFPLILGWEGAGTITEVGEGVSRNRIGEEVYLFARSSKVRWGTFCEFTIFPSEHVITKPTCLTLAEASTIALTGLTAWQALVDVLALKREQTILIHGGGGGLGSFAIQLAKHLGAYVYTTVSKDKRDYASKMGADMLIDYKAGPFCEQIRFHEPNGIDTVLDTIGGETLETSYRIVRPGGRLVSVASRAVLDPPREFELSTDFVSVQPKGEQLKAISQLFEEGQLQPPDLQIRPLDEVVSALTEAQQGHTKGKVTLRIS